MVDFHSHILPGVDDGSRNEPESIKLLQEAKEAGFDKVISTSHYALDLYEIPEYKRVSLIESLQSEPNIPSIYLGSEIYSTHTIVDLIKEGKASTLNNTKYVLFELPLFGQFPDLPGLINKIKEYEYIPVLAHPERYHIIQKDYNFLFTLKDMGVLFQSNYGSIIGQYGSKAKKIVKKMLKDQLISFMGSDVHRPDTVYPRMDKILKKISKITDVGYFEAITTNNAEAVLEGRNI